MSPAKNQFDGVGSWGNGGAMRIAPLSLFCHDNYDRLVDYAKKVTEITHTHKWGIDGAILQVITNRLPLLLERNIYILYRYQETR